MSEEGGKEERGEGEGWVMNDEESESGERERRGRENRPVATQNSASNKKSSNYTPGTFPANPPFPPSLPRAPSSPHLVPL